MNQIISVLSHPAIISEALDSLWSKLPFLPNILTRYIRYGLFILAFLTVICCIASLLKEHYSPELWGYLRSENNAEYPLNHWENIIGRAKSSDIVLTCESAARMHASLTRDADGKWWLTPLDRRFPLLCNGESLARKTEVFAGDLFTVGNVLEGTSETFVFEPLTYAERQEQSRRRLMPGFMVRPWAIFLWLTEFIILLGAQAVISAGANLSRMVIPSFLILIFTMWAYFAFLRALGRTGFEIEALAFFLTSIGLAMISSSHPGDLVTWVGAFLIGLFCFFILCLLLRKLDFAQKLRWIAAAGALGLLAATLIFGKDQNGARNWIKLGSMSLQPSELAKVCFICAGTATLDRLFAKRNLILFVFLAAACVGMLAIMSDFGTALIFFVTFIVIAFMRSGDFASLLFVLTGAGIGGFLILEIKPYIANRFAAWRHAWDYASSAGYQQVRTMSAGASGGLFGMGLGHGWLKNIAAADTDLVFGMVCEELGLLIALLAIISVITIALFAIRSATLGRSTFYVIAACAAGAAMVMQIVLNVFGSVDILPLTGVTFPFVSNGGSSMVSAWCLLAFIKAADTREHASIAVGQIKED